MSEVVSFGLPGGRLHGSKRAPSALLAGVVASRRSKCPSQFKARPLTMILHGFFLVFSYSLSLLMIFGQWIFSIRLRNFRWMQSVH